MRPRPTLQVSKLTPGHRGLGTRPGTDADLRTECLIEYIANPQARGQSCPEGLRPTLSRNAIQFAGEKLDAHASSARSGAFGPFRVPRQPAKSLSRPDPQANPSACSGA